MTQAEAEASGCTVSLQSGRLIGIGSVSEDSKDSWELLLGAWTSLLPLLFLQEWACPPCPSSQVVSI